MKKNGKRYRKLHNGEVNKRVRIPSPYPCPKCGERYRLYLPEKQGSCKGISIGDYFFDGVFDPHYGHHYHCHTCNHEWKVRTSKRSLWIKIFPFLANK